MVQFKDKRCLFLYPGLAFGIYGTMTNKWKLESGQYCRVHLTMTDKMPDVKLDIVSEKPVSFYLSTSLQISNRPLEQDPYEQQTIYVGQSNISPDAGEGLFAKRDIPEGHLVALFNGVRQRDPVFSARKQPEFSDYRISLRTDVSLDIPATFVSLNKYRATLGHKCCHSFKNNAKFVDIRHPRYGHIMSVVAQRDIAAHEEVLVSYNYRICQAPRWYVDLWFKHLREDQNLSEETLHVMARKEARLGGFPISVPPPNRNSDRFLPCPMCDEHIGLNNNSVSCAGNCHKWFHCSCVSLGPEANSKKDQISHWICQDCTKPTDK